MKRLFQYVLLIGAFTNIISVPKLFAQDAISSKAEKRNQLSIGMGFLGLLYLDEFRQQTPFTRKAFPPVFVQFERHICKRLSIGAYFGLEHEIQSGTYKDFNGPTTSIVYGLLTDFHLIRFSKRNFLDPYIGLSFFYYNSLGLEKTILPGLRIGCNFKIYRDLNIRINTGAGAGLIETGLTFKI